MSIIPFRPRARQRLQRQHADHGISGLFWLQPVAQQHQRVRELHHGAHLSLETIAAITRLRLREVSAIIEARQ